MPADVQGGKQTNPSLSLSSERLTPTLVDLSQPPSPSPLPLPRPLPRPRRRAPQYGQLVRGPQRVLFLIPFAPAPSLCRRREFLCPCCTTGRAHRKFYQRVPCLQSGVEFGCTTGNGFERAFFPLVLSHCVRVAVFVMEKVIRESRRAAALGAGRRGAAVPTRQRKVYWTGDVWSVRCRRPEGVCVRA